MRLHIIATGKIGRSPEADLVARYLARIGWPTAVTEISEGAAPPPPPPHCRTVLLDERGDALDSAAFAALLGRWRDDGVREARFVIGAADGHTQAARAAADRLIAFGPATWPHMLARAMLAEQLYRATAIIAGHPYHRS
jgi:23S rRNA (pseudouridine1915-N3)-methyltransferase